jgi:hypothetical protein
MATTTNTNANTDAGCSCASSSFPVAQFQPFEWIPSEGLDAPRQNRASFLNDARDVVQGTQTLAQLLSWDEDRRDTAATDAGPAPLFNACQRESLQRLLAASLGLLHARIEAQCDALNG